jgi:acetyl/propionyl-CoA carboxylase alpha subunit
VDDDTGLDRSMSTEVTDVGGGMYRVIVNGRSEIVWTAVAGGERWAFWNGRLFTRRDDRAHRGPRAAPRTGGRQSLAAPMPATVLKVLVAPGAKVRKGDTLMILEAMKMELPVRAAGDGLVRAVSAREGELVQAGAPLVELE